MGAVSLENVPGYTPVQTDLAFLPLSQAGPHAAYLTALFPAYLVLGLGAGTGLRAGAEEAVEPLAG